MTTALRRAIHGLYAVTPDTASTARLVAQVEAAIAGGARMIQYRNKAAGSALRLTQARALLAVCRRQGVPLIVNDHLDVALEIDADGVHLGSDDCPVRAARSRLGASRMLGVSCYAFLQNAVTAELAGADYVAFGSFFASAVKPGAARAPLSLLHEAKRVLTVPVVAIGGITQHNAAQLLEAGADAVAVISAVFDAENVKLAARQFDDLFRAVT
jgi:thiamine-phosphate pyrophosphorylase